MLIFYAWVVFLAAIILSVPIVYWIEQSRRKQAQRAAEPEDDAADVADEDLSEDAAGEEMPEDLSEFGAATPVGEDDFSAFEEEFK